MAKRRRLKSASAASMIRKAIEDGRFDAALWGVPAQNGVESPRFKMSYWWKGIGGEPAKLCELYDEAYGRARLTELRRLWPDRTTEDFRAAKLISEHNRLLRTESPEARELRLLREELRAAKGESTGELLIDLPYRRS